MINKRIFLAVFSLLLSSHQQLLFAYGLEPTPSSIDQDVEGERGGSKASSFTIPRVDVIGSQNNLLKIPSSAQLVNDEDLQSSHASTSNEALRKVPGIHVRDEEGLGTRLNIGIRGLNPTRSTKVLLLEDGIPVTFSPYGDNGSYYHPLIERYERIEVLKGMAQIAGQTGLSREQLYRSFSENGNPTLKTTLAVMNALGIELTAKLGAAA